MAGIARALRDTAGGVITGGLNTRVLVERLPAVVLGDAVISHGSDAHAAATMLRSSFRVKATGKFVCRAGDTASCGHPATGSGKVEAG